MASQEPKDAAERSTGSVNQPKQILKFASTILEQAREELGTIANDDDLRFIAENLDITNFVTSSIAILIALVAVAFSSLVTIPSLEGYALLAALIIGIIAFGIFIFGYRRYKLGLIRAYIEQRKKLMTSAPSPETQIKQASITESTSTNDSEDYERKLDVLLEEYRKAINASDEKVKQEHGLLFLQFKVVSLVGKMQVASTKQVEKSSKRLESLTGVLLLLTIVLGIFTVFSAGIQVVQLHQSAILTYALIAVPIILVLVAVWRIQPLIERFIQSS